MGLYRKKVIVVSAEQWRPEDPTAGGVVWNGGWGIQTLEGFMHVSPGDWIITGIKGEKYPCKPDIFEATYEPVERDRGEG